MSKSTETKTFTLGQVLTITHGRMLCPVGDIYNILNWMTGESLMTHQLPRASRESEDFLRQQFPELDTIDVESATITNEAEGRALLESLAPQYGTHRDVLPLAAEDHTVIDPLEELRMMRPEAEIITVHHDKSA